MPRRKGDDKLGHMLREARQSLRVGGTKISRKRLAGILDTSEDTVYRREIGESFPLADELIVQLNKMLKKGLVLDRAIEIFKYAYPQLAVPWGIEGQKANDEETLDKVGTQAESTAGMSLADLKPSSRAQTPAINDASDVRELVTVLVILEPEARLDERIIRRLKNELRGFGKNDRETIIDDKSIQFETFISIGHGFKNHVNTMLIFLKRVQGVKEVKVLWDS